MRGGYLRFQAQHIRRIRLPYWEKVPDNIRRELIKAVSDKSREACNRVVFKLYKLNMEERIAISPHLSPLFAFW